ncbi:hypothetical protein FRB97_001876 [Tulasnella sp. 331]|nr:hypothetical protein FRB97_001876 [Tulasnella sp. 331]
MSSISSGMSSGMMMADGNKVDPRQGHDFSVYSVGNVLTLVVVVLLIVTFLGWIAWPYLPSRHQSQHLPIQTPPPTKRTHATFISSPLTPPKGSIWGEWPSTKDVVIVGDEELGLGEMERNDESDWEKKTSSMISGEFETAALLVPPESAYIPHKRHTYHHSSLNSSFRDLVDPFHRQKPKLSYKKLDVQTAPRPPTVAVVRPSTAC